MPLSRYLFRNEFCLADPELYKAADKNDPEALLEGVAMAGLVGVLRQLGDLSEFAAEIFNDLHEEVLATASRGHGLKIRVQQLEAEFPSIEKAFLSQTNQSLFLYNEGIDWHPNLRIDQNLITRGDLPRSVMDSYEECRGPPRLFLLDKFDIAGVGACLKRYSDPSFFKAELTSGSAKADSQREKKRKIRKKGSLWKIRDMPEGFAKSHAKLHQLFSEERIQTGINVPTNRVKLKKRQLTGFLFDSTSGKSYMERFLKTRSPEHRVHEAMKPSSFSELVIRDRHKVRSPDRHERILQICMEDLTEYVTEEASFEEFLVPTSDIELEKDQSNLHKVEGRKEEMVVGESKTEGSADGYPSDDVISEMDNYMDALTTMESELETDTECRPKNERGFFHIERKRLDSDKGEELQELKGLFSDSRSVENSSASDDGTNSFKKGGSSFSYSDSPSSSAENVLPDVDASLKLDPSTESSPAEYVDKSSPMLCENGDALGARSSEHPVSSDVSEFPSYRYGFGEVSHDSSTNSTFTLSHISEKESTGKVEIVGSDSTEISSSFTNDGTLGLSANSEEYSTNVSDELPCRIGVSDFPSQTSNVLLPVKSGKGKPEGSLDKGVPIEPSDTLLHLPNVLNLEKKDSDDALEEMLPKEYAENNCVTMNLLNAVLDSSCTVSLPSVEQLDGLAEQDQENSSSTSHLVEDIPGSPSGSNDLDDVEPGEKKVTPSTGENSDYLASEEGDLETGDFVDLKFPDMTNEVPLSELDSTKVSSTNSEVERLNNDVDVSSECTVSCTPNQASETEIDMQLADSVNGRIHDEADKISEVVGCDQVSLLSEDHINEEECHLHDEDHLQEKHVYHNGDLDPFIVEIPDPSSSENLTGSAAQKAAVDQAPVSPSEIKFMLPNPESPSASKVLNCVYNEMLVEDQSHLHLGDGAKVATSLGEGHQEAELRKPQSDLWGNAEDATSPFTHSLLKPPAASGKSMESQAEQHNVGTLLADGEVPKLFDHESERLQIPSNTCHDGCFDGPSVSSSSQDFSHLPEPQFSQLPASHKVESSEPSTSSTSFFPSFDIFHVARHQQLEEPQKISPVLDLPLPAPEAVETSVTEIPPLPPLPPLEWRIGKLQPRSLSSEREVVQCSFNPFSLVTADEQAQWRFTELHRELEQPLNPFLAVNNDELLDGSGIDREMVQSSLNPFLSPLPMVGDEKIKQDFLALERNVAQPLNPFLSPATENEKSPHYSLDSGVRLLQPDSDDFSPLPSNEDVNAQNPSLNLDGDMVQCLNSLSLMQDREDENSRDAIKFSPSPRNEDVNSQHPSQDLDGEVVQPWDSSLLIQDRADDNSRDNIDFSLSPLNEDVNAQHPSLNLDCEVVQPSSSSLLIQDREDENTQDTILFAPSPSNEDASAQNSSLGLEDKVVQLSNSLPLDREDEKPQDASLTSEEEKVQLPYLFRSPPAMGDGEQLWTLENEKFQHVSFSLEEELAWQPSLYVIPPVEENPNRSRKAWLHRPRDPLIEAVASHDKSTLRKVTERIQPQAEPKVDERDSLLQQIRAKSFNLKPTVATRPSIQAPNSNLRVAAILEKANAIRQALAGSDEDDDSESWSDS